MRAIAHLRFWVAGLLLLGGSTAVAQSPVSQGWGVGVDASRALGGHAVIQMEHAQSSEWLWQVAVGTYVGAPQGVTPSWKGLKGDVLSGSVVSLGTLVFPQQDPKLGALWFLGVDVSKAAAFNEAQKTPNCFQERRPVFAVARRGAVVSGGPVVCRSIWLCVPMWAWEPFENACLPVWWEKRSARCRWRAWEWL